MLCTFSALVTAVAGVVGVFVYDALPWWAALVVVLVLGYCCFTVWDSWLAWHESPEEDADEG